MILDSVSILNFKNLEQCETHFSHGINCFLGGNGAGKTNLLDAIHFLSLTKSSLPMTDGQCVRHGSDFFMLRGDYLHPQQSGEVVVCSYKQGAGKTLRRNGKEYTRVSEHIGLVPVVLVCPGDTALIEESGEERRRFLNSFLCQIDSLYLSEIIKYNTLLGERNKMLKHSSSGAFDEVMEVVDMQLCQTAAVIYAKREEFIARLAPLVAEYYRVLSGDCEQVTVSYQSHLHGDTMDNLLRKSAQRDRIMGHTTVGIHRDDMLLRIMDYPIRKYGSQGQQKSMLIALKLAQYDIIKQMRSVRPLLLLDDVFDKLDMNRVEQLIALVSGDHFGQIFISDANKVRMEGVLGKLSAQYRLFNVEAGVLTE